MNDDVVEARISEKFDITEIEKKWQSIWLKEKAFSADNNSQLQKYYILEMFPYPSGKVHVGHARNYTIGDVVARFMRMMGYNVLHPMGWDAFGLPAENAAIANNISPKDWTYSNIEIMKMQLKRLGLSYDWDREIISCDPSYYKYEQEFFLHLYDKSIIYQKMSAVNWDPVDQTVLANEQVVNGRGWRSGAVVEKKYLNQWFLKITSYAEELLLDLDNLKNWPESIRLAQKNWIGKSCGINFTLNLDGFDEKITVYSTKPETLFGATFIGVACEHDIIKLVKQDKKIIEFIKNYNNFTSEAELDNFKKDGIFTGLCAIHPFDHNRKIPVLIVNFVVMDYGSGAIFGCPAHDERDHELAKNIGLPIIQVISNNDNLTDINNKPHIGEGFMINSDFLNGLSIKEARERSINKLEELGVGERAINYRLRDWGVSRQRYWGCPIPIIYCDNCGVVTVPLDQLPVKLPDDVEITGRGGNPLNHSDWIRTLCPKCGKNARRETDTFDTFMESSWYFLRYCKTNSTKMLDQKATNYWLPIDLYIGGAEHAVMHLLYARFFTKLMADFDSLSVREPFKKLINQGMVLHRTYKDNSGKWIYPEETINKDGAIYHKITNQQIVVGNVEKMSKSKKNLINLEAMLDDYGADIIRLFIVSDSPVEKDLEWSMNGIEGAKKFIKKLISFEKIINNLESQITDQNNYANDQKLEYQIHNTIKLVTMYIRDCSLNVAIATMRDLFNKLNEYSKEKFVNKAVLKKGYKILLQLLNPFIPHITEEIWWNMNEKVPIFKTSWPKYDEKKIVASSYMIAVQVCGKLRGSFEAKEEMTEEEIKNLSVKIPNVAKYIGEKTIKKIILIPKKIVNIII